MGYMEDFKDMAFAVIVLSCLRGHDPDVGTIQPLLQHDFDFIVRLVFKDQ